MPGSSLACLFFYFQNEPGIHLVGLGIVTEIMRFSLMMVIYDEQARYIYKKYLLRRKLLDIIK